MRPETWLARLVFALGALVMIATSAPPQWGAEKSLEAELQSEGQGDDKLVRIHVRLTDGVATDARQISVHLSGLVDRPASDLTIVWLDADASAPDAGPKDAGLPVAFYTSPDFLTVSSSTERARVTSTAENRELIFEGRIATESSDAYAMTLALTVSIRGSKEKRPKGEIEASVEVLDAP